MSIDLACVATVLSTIVTIPYAGLTDPPESSEGGYFEFGHDIALESGVMAVATQGCEFDRATSGMVFVFRKNNGQWQEEAVLQPNLANPEDGFGAATALSGDWCLVGAPNKKSVVVFLRQAGTWKQQAELQAPDSHRDTAFGASIALNGNVCVIGAPGYRESGSHSAAFVFRFNGESWQHEAIVVPSELDPESCFGQNVRISDHTIAVAAPYENNVAGAVYVFAAAQDGTWKQTDRLIDEAGASRIFGSDLSLCDRHLGICSYPLGNNPRRILVYHQNGDGWRLQATLSAEADANPATFGGSVSIHDDVLVAGAGGGMRLCQVRVYRLEQDRWMLKESLLIEDPKPEDRSARCLAVDGQDIAMGSTTGNTAGLVHTFRRTPTGWIASQRLDGSGLPNRGYSDEPLVKRLEETPPALTREQIQAMSLEEARFAAKWVSAARARVDDDATDARLRQEFVWLMEHLRALQR